MADFGRGIKAGVITGVVYIVVSAILGTIYHYPLSAPFPMYAAGLTPFSLTDLANLSLVTALLFQYIVRGIIFGAVFAAMYHYLPGVTSTLKGVVLSSFFCIVALIEVIYMTPGWPTDGVSYAGSYYSGRIQMSSSFGMLWPGILSTLIFGALTGFLWDGLRAKRLTEVGKSNPILLLSFIVGALTWAVLAAGFLVGVLIGGGSPIQPEFWWSNLLFTSVVFLGLPGFILADVAWMKAKADKSGFKWGVVGGVLMVLTGIMMLPGLLAIIGGVLSGRKPVSELSTTANVGKQNRYMPRVGILSIAVVFLIMVALIAGTVGFSPPSQDLEIRTWYDLDAVRDNLHGHHILMNDLDPTTDGYTDLASPTANQGKGWQPIGAFSTQQSTADHGILGFEGTFDGQGYEIHDLFINRPDEGAVGLFLGVGQEGVIKDIGMVNATLTGNTSVGTLVGWNRGTVHDSHSIGNVTGNHTVGGLVGVNEGSVSNSHSSANVTAYFGVGGLMGWNLGTVSNSHSTGIVTGNYNVGGLAGWNFGTVSNSYSSVNVTGTGGVGGLVGSGSGTVSNCYATSSVTGNESVGGLVGGGASNVSKSYSTGSVTGNSSVGGLVGKNEISTISNSFWDIETSEQATSEGGTGKTTAEMQYIATFLDAAWDIVAVGGSGERNPVYSWNIVDDLTYPFLSWQS